MKLWQRARAPFLGTFLLLLPLMAAAGSAVQVQPLFTIHGKVVDRENRVVPGAEVAVYRSPDIRRPVDFLIATAEDGTYRLAVPPGKFWVVARHRRSAGLGPLHPMDRHSGDPMEISGETAEEITADFTVAGIREFVQQKEQVADGTVTFTGKLTDGGGVPAADAYVYARRQREATDVPDFVSAWTGSSGEYTLSLPPGRYFMGTASEFPPRSPVSLTEIMVTGEKLTVVMDMQIRVQ